MNKTQQPAVAGPVEPTVMQRLGPWVPHQPENAAGCWVVAYANDLHDVGSGDGGYSAEEAHVMAAGPAMAAALDCIVRRLQMDVDDGSRPDHWSMQDLIRTAKAALPAGWVIGAA
jgi:hypothetical protein